MVVAWPVHLAAQTDQISTIDGFPPALSSQMQSALDDWAREPGHRGVSASVILADGHEWVGTAGVEGAETDLLPNHLIWIASITKSMTGAVILGLADDGELTLEDPVSRWLDDNRNVDPDITHRQL